jgi:GntR family phosphonate transport system transcriptional regulator
MHVKISCPEVGVTLIRGDGVALWRQIHQSLHREIADGVFAPGERLPGEIELAFRFGVNRHTVRRALAGLEDEGVIRIEQGRGTFVQQQVIPYRISRRTRFTENLTRLNRAPGGVLLRTAAIAADKAVAEALAISRGEPVVLLETTGEADGLRISVCSHYLPRIRFDGIDRVFGEERSMTEAFHRFGVGDYERLRTTVTARMPTAEEAAVLGQPRSRPLLVSEAVNIDAEGVPIEYGITRFRSDRVQIVFER